MVRVRIVPKSIMMNYDHSHKKSSHEESDNARMYLITVPQCS